MDLFQNNVLICTFYPLHILRKLWEDLEIKKYFRELIILSSVFWILLAIDISRMNIYYNKRILTDAMFTCMGEIYLLKDKTFFSRTMTLKIKLSFIIFSTSLNPYWYYLKCNLGFWYLFVEYNENCRDM